MLPVRIMFHARAMLCAGAGGVCNVFAFQFPFVDDFYAKFPAEDRLVSAVHPFGPSELNCMGNIGSARS